MSDILKYNVQSRKDAIFNTYDIKDEKMLKKIDDYFERLEEFASKFTDSMEFETAFAQDKLSKEYSDLFVKITGSGITPKSLAKDATTTLASEIKEDITHRARRKAYQETYDKARDMPIIGDVMHVKQHIDFFSRFKKKKDNTEEE